MSLLIKFPSRGRPEQLFTIASIYVEYAADMTKIRMLISLDTDDKTVTPEVIKKLKNIHKNVQVVVGTSCGKIGAINRDMPHPSTFSIVLLASDDMIPVQKGYDNIIREKMAKHYPDTDGVLFFNDGFHKNKLNTIVICGSKYYSRFGYIYYPGYKSLWCDNEFMDVANFLKKQTYFPEVIIKHEHPGTNSVIIFDETYTRNQVFYYEDEALYFSRRPIVSEMYNPRSESILRMSPSESILRMPSSFLTSPIKLPPVSIRIRR
jgi:hypothetical protein